MPFTNAVQLDGHSAVVKELETHSIAIKDLYPLTQNVKQIEQFSVKFNETAKKNAKFSTVLPFRVSFTNITVGTYGPSNPAPLGIAIIGLNNYIL